MLLGLVTGCHMEIRQFLVPGLMKEAKFVFQQDGIYVITWSSHLKFLLLRTLHKYIIYIVPIQQI